MDSIIDVIGAIAALGTAAYGLVDCLKALPGGGVSKIGLGHLWNGLRDFEPALAVAAPDGDWKAIVHAHWINGRPKDQQKAIVRSMIRLGLRPETAPALAKVGHVDEGALAEVVRKLLRGEELTPEDVNVLGRVDASVETRIDAAFDRSEQQYRNTSRVLAGAIAVVLACLGALAIGSSVRQAALVGLLAVPLAPVAKDLSSSLAAAASAVKAVRGRP